MIFYLNETLFPYIMENFFIYYEISFSYIQYFGKFLPKN